jgi:hypothetical protein
MNSNGSSSVLASPPLRNVLRPAAKTRAIQARMTHQPRIPCRSTSVKRSTRIETSSLNGSITPGAAPTPETPIVAQRAEPQQPIQVQVAKVFPSAGE